MAGKEPTNSGGDDWAQIDAAFQAALEQSPDQRVEWVNTQFAAQTEIRDAVLSLLADEKPSEALFESAFNERDRIAREVIAGEDGADQAGNLVGSMIGSYRLEELMATGGMGAVYRAERADGQFQQTVAIKILPGWATDAQTIARLKAERQILAELQHPNITHLLDGGETGDGFPYLVTEFIDGEPITEYARQSLPRIKHRLELFAKVADTVHYAHKKLVIHRDIKPSNILVDKSGRPHLLDFGIAKLLEAGAHDMTFAQTATGFTPMTPEYASPEQRTGKEVTTASDIYQLGLLLYHLMTGSRPARDGVSSAGSVTRPSTAVLSTESTKKLPGEVSGPRLARKLKGDLDTIVLKALRQDPDERYASAAEMAADVRRHLQGEAIEARPETLWSATKRLSRHYPLAAILTVSLAVVLVIWATSMYFYAQKLEVQRDEATRQASRATHVKNVLIDIFRRSDPLQADTIGGKTASVWDSLDAASTEAREQLADEPEIQAELFATLASLFRYAGELDKSMALQKETVAIYQSLGAGYETELAISRAEYAANLGRNKFDEALPIMDKALASLPAITRNDPTAAVSLLLDAANLQKLVGNYEKALGYLTQSRNILDENKIEDPSLRIEVLSTEADILIDQDELSLAEPLLLQTLKLGEQLFGADHRILTETLSSLAALERRRGNTEKNIGYALRVVEMLEEDSGTTYQSLLSAKNNLAIAYGTAGRYRDEQRMFRELIAIQEQIDGPEGSVELAIANKNLATSLHLTGDFEEALDALAEATVLFNTHFPSNSPYQALPHFTRALVYLDSNQPAEQAETEARATLSILEPVLGQDHFQVHVTRCVIAETYRRQGRLDEAKTLAEPAMQGILASGTKTQVYIDRCQESLAALDVAL